MLCSDVKVSGSFHIIIIVIIINKFIIIIIIIIFNKFIIIYFFRFINCTICDP